MKKTVVKLVAVTLVAVLLLPFCGGIGRVQASGAPVTLTGFMTSGQNQSAIDKATWFTSWLAEEMGIKLEFVDAAGTAPAQIIQNMLTSRELPDLIQFGGIVGHGFANTSAQTGLLINLEDYKDALPSIFENPHYQYAIEYSRENLSGGTGNVYCLPMLIGPWNPAGNENPQLRWDIYRELGMPALPTLESLSDVVEAMLAIYPETEEGLSTMGFSGTPEFDGTNGLFYIQHYVIALGRRIIPGFVEVDIGGGEKGGPPISAIDDSAQMLRVLRWLNDAQKRGLIDPDSAVQTFDEMQAKSADGRVMLTHWAWDGTAFNTPARVNAEPPVGYAAVWTDDMYPPIRCEAWTGALETMAISANSKNLDKALELLNFFYSFDGYDFMVNGPKGELWDLDADGNRYRTEKGWDAFLLNTANTFMEGGGLRADAMSIFGYGPVTNYTVNPTYGDQTIQSAYWKDTLMYNPSKLVVEWRENHEGALDIYQWALPRDRVSKTTPATDMMAAMPDDITIKLNDISNMINEKCWQMIYAKDDAEFDALWAEIKITAEGYGLAEVQEWTLAAWANALDMAERYSPAQ